MRQLADGDGDVQLAQGYSPFGQPLWSEGNGATGYGFTGERWDGYIPEIADGTCRSPLEVDTVAVIHRACRFDPDLFHKQLDERIVQQGHLNSSALLQLAREIVATASEMTWQALKDLRFDDEWLGASSDEVSWTTHWYMIALASRLVPVPSLSNHSPVSWKTLELALPLIGWSESEVQLLLRGEPLHTLIESSANPRFISEFTCIDQFGGWLSQEKVGRLYSRLAQVEGFHLLHFVSESIAEFAMLWSQNPTEMLYEAYTDAMDMLRETVDQSAALFIVLD